MLPPPRLYELQKNTMGEGEQCLRNKYSKTSGYQDALFQAVSNQNIFWAYWDFIHTWKSWRQSSLQKMLRGSKFLKGSVNIFSEWNGWKNATSTSCSGASQSGRSLGGACLGWSLATKYSRPRGVAVVYRTADKSGFWADETLSPSRATPISWVVWDITRNIRLIVGTQKPRRVSALYHKYSET